MHIVKNSFNTFQKLMSSPIINIIAPGYTGGYVPVGQILL